MSYRDWHVGMKVVCVAARPSHAPADAYYPEIDCIYTIRQLRDDGPLGGRGIVVLLAEIDNSHFVGRPFYREEPGFSPKGFRPVQKRKTDISIFTAMLHGNKERAPA